MMVWAAVLLLAFAGQPQGQQNMVVNGSFETDADGDGLADGWEYAAGVGPEAAPSVKLYRDAGKVGRWCQVVRCTAYKQGHVMLAQRGTVAVEAGKRYELTFWARGEGLGPVYVGIQDTRTWKHVGLWRSFQPPKKWRRFRFVFTAIATADKTTRLQVWFRSTGVLWLDDVALVPVGEGGAEYVIRWLPGRRNALPNASFELGPVGWITFGYWRLQAEVVEGNAAHGRRCLRIVADRQKAPRAIFDYYVPTVRTLDRLAATTKYWIALERGAEYTMSGYARAEGPAQILVGVRFRRGEAARQYSVPPDGKWHRFSVTFKARDEFGYAFFGPILPPEGKPAAVVWVDAVQLEPGEAATDFQPRSPVEVAATVEPWRPLVGERLPGVVLDVVACTDGPSAATTRLRWQATDFFGRGLGRGTVSIAVPPGQQVRRQIVVTRDPVAFARVRLWADGNPLPPLRTAVAGKPYGAGQTRLGFNHAYPWDEWLELSRRFGVTWVRDWTLKWDWLEPRPGALDVAKADLWINRPLELGMAELCMFPFPSAVWAAEKPPKPGKVGRKLNRPIESAFRPRDIGAFKRYIRACVERYRNRIKHWEIFNESLFTTYSLPQRFGYRADDYVPLLKAAHEAIRQADAKAFVIGGYSAPPTTPFRDYYERMFALGGLKMCDAVSIHHYPGGEPEGIEADLQAMGRLMDAAGGRKPMWLTEFAYYADDDPTQGRQALQWPRLVEDELAQALWTQRYCALSLANGVTHIFFHIWSARPHFDSGAALFFEDDGEPRKVAVAVLALVRVLSPSPQPVGCITAADDGRCVLVFRRDDGKSAGMVWDAWATTTPVGTAPAGTWYDATGRRLRRAPKVITPAPVFVVSSASPQALVAALRRWSGI